MYLAITPSQFNPHYVMLSDKTKNNVIRDRVRVEIHGTSSRKGVKKAVRHLVNDLGMYTHGLLK